MQKIIKTILVFMLMLASMAALANDQSLSQIRQRSEIVVGMDILYGSLGSSVMDHKMLCLVSLRKELFPVQVKLNALK